MNSQDDNAPHRGPRGPVWFSLCAMCIGLMVLGLSLLQSPLVLAQHVLAPYTVDLYRGVSTKEMIITRAVLVSAQLLVVLFVFLETRALRRAGRIAVTLLGILSVLAYGLLVTVIYVVPRLH